MPPSNDCWIEYTVRAVLTPSLVVCIASALLYRPNPTLYRPNPTLYRPNPTLSVCLSVCPVCLTAEQAKALHRVGDIDPETEHSIWAGTQCR